MKISFFGASKEVTGSCFLIETENTKFLVDCGMFQGEGAYEKNCRDFSFNPKEIDFLLLTHAHIDHCGRLPILVKKGFKGKIFCTKPTAELAVLMMLDSAKIFLSNQGKKMQDPLYYDYDIEDVNNLFSCLEYGEEKIISPRIKVIARDAGHILGSCIYEVEINDNNQLKKIVFSGDLGNSPSVILNDTNYISGADAVLIESTYGNGLHEPRAEGRKKLKEVILQTIEKKANLIIPIFALERIQEILYDLNEMAENKEISYVPIFLDSPLAIKTIEIYRKYIFSYFNQSTINLIKSGDDIFSFQGLKFTPEIKQSLAIEKVKPPKIILAGGGMLTGGRVVGYLDDYISKAKNNILLVSYQAEGTLGRELLEGAKKIRIEKKNILVRAQIFNILSFSSHGDSKFLLNWIERISNPKPKHIFVVHGEEQSSSALAEKIKEKNGNVNCFVPDFGQTYEI
ncbi:MAG: MBL fold metallo-hydrolase [Candidatus Paceibacterota bacterium]